MNTERMKSIEEQFAKLTIITFLKQKKILIDGFLGTDSKYVTEEDFDDIRGLSASDCMKIMEVLGDSDEMDEYGFGDADICPWCIIFPVELGLLKPSPWNHDCARCSYGKRHGICSKPDSLYNRLYYHIGSRLDKRSFAPISSIPDMSNLVKFYSKRFSIILQERNDFL